MIFPLLIWLWPPFATVDEGVPYYTTDPFNDSKTKRVVFKTKQLSDSSKLYGFYGAPITQFTIDVVFYALFLILYTYVCLEAFELALHWTEICLLVWVSIMVTTESYQIYQDGIRTYLSGVWNVNDLIIILLYFTSFGIRMIENTQFYYIMQSKTILGLNAIPVFLRIVRFYAVSENLGPKIGELHSYIRYLTVVYELKPILSHC